MFALQSARPGLGYGSGHAVDLFSDEEDDDDDSVDDDDAGDDAVNNSRGGAAARLTAHSTSILGAQAPVVFASYHAVC